MNKLEILQQIGLCTVLIGFIPVMFFNFWHLSHVGASIYFVCLVILTLQKAFKKEE